jgi:hypothetical protein
MTRRWRTTGVVPPATTEMYQNENGEWMRDGGATWDADKRRWKRTLWKLTDPAYRVYYNDGTEAIEKERPEIVEPVEMINPEDSPLEVMAGEEPVERRVTKSEEVPASWELATEYVSSSEKPEWDEYFTREIMANQPIYAPLPQEREDGGDFLQQRAKRRKIVGIPTLGALR